MSSKRLSIKRRLSVATVALIAGCIGLLLAAVYWSTVGAGRQVVDRSVHSEVGELLDAHQEGGAPRLEQELARRMHGGDADRGFLYLYSERSRIVVGNMLRPEGLEGIEGLGTLMLQEREVRVYRAVLDDERELVVARDVTQSRTHERILLTVVLAAVGIAIAFAIGMGLALSHNLVGRVQRMNRTIVSILAGEREARVPESGRHDEFEELAQHFNGLLDENEKLVSQMRGVTDDIAHDLRTPLARVRSRVETALGHELAAKEYEDVLQDILADTSGLLETFQALLSIAKIESGTICETMTQIDLSELASDVVELYEPVAEESGVTLTSVSEPNLAIRGNRHLLSQALTNLVDNAIKFSSAPAHVEVQAVSGAHGIEVRVTDNGPGIPPEDRERVLQRFVRLDASRQRPGTGLGLSLVAAVAKIHGAKLLLEDNQPGLTVSLVFDEPSTES